jgi:hypothetical protein
LALTQVDNKDNRQDYILETSVEKTAKEEAGNRMNCMGGKWIIWRHCVVAATDATITSGQGGWWLQQQH